MKNFNGVGIGPLSKILAVDASKHTERNRFRDGKSIFKLQGVAIIHQMTVNNIF